MSNELAELVREHGVQNGAPWLAVLWTASGRPHCTANSVAEEIGAISRQAVYGPSES